MVSNIDEAIKDNGFDNTEGFSDELLIPQQDYNKQNKLDEENI